MRLRFLLAVGASVAVATPAALSMHLGAVHHGPGRPPSVAAADHDARLSRAAARDADHRAGHAPGRAVGGAQGGGPGSAPDRPARRRGPSGIHKIRHIIVIMQENRSFDSYFGTFPGADGIPAGVCVPDPLHGGCVRPHPDHHNSELGGPHEDPNFAADVDGGRMDGFVTQAETKGRCAGPRRCRAAEVMGYHAGSDIPNYWAYAKNFVLNDHMYESAHSWSLPSHMYMVSAWAADCTDPQNPMSCAGTDMPRNRTAAYPTPFAWTDLTWLLHRYHVSWGYYLDHGAQTPADPAGVPTIWNVLPGFTDVTQDDQMNDVQPLTSFMAQARAGTLPQLSWIVPDPKDSEHPPALISTGQAYVTRLVNAVMRSRDWSSSAIFLSWDDWGGFYDHVNPLRRQLDAAGYGIRVPALVISPYAKAGFIDHQTLSFDAYLKFIEDDFMGGARLDPATDGRPDSRPDVRENASILGNLVSDFDFHQAPRPPFTLNPCPPTTLRPRPKPGCRNSVPLHFGTWGDS
jgi:phospholipase C